MYGKFTFLNPCSAITYVQVHYRFESSGIITNSFSDIGFPFTAYITF